ncbi:osmoprotectant transport system ATP-binding protein [Collimonas sp. PA-H2]|uniref:ABC transporter ATP-binding protein n=1 Tax=Collimonas sp. PA-H2 TaxID=1881062 RepID=UPI000BF8A4F3|nr:ABC transporter ATP-binding protein [Collimonas sp. PA-H2]PFH12322.1 osmoprotectant transport system ATP-binding protein [Collimonas sp. PA-H2]
MIEIENISKSFDGRLALDNVSLAVNAGELAVLIGSSGSGKSTLLKLFNRLLEPDSGNIRLLGQDITDYSPEQLRRRIGYAIQSVGLFPHWTVEQNIAAVPTLLKWPKARIQQRVDELLALLHLAPESFRHRYPHQLSGGQQQRVGVARALAADPEVLLMDEPFGALDPLTRSSLQQELANIHAISGKTIVLVTHDIDEALALGERIVLLDHGRIVQQGAPRDFLLAPASDLVRDFVGQSDVGIRLLGLDKIATRVRAEPAIEGEPIRSDGSLREALSAFITRKVYSLPVVDEHGQSAGVLHFADLLTERT